MSGRHFLRYRCSFITSIPFKDSDAHVAKRKLKSAI
jgi:hypothetical protein